MEKCYCGNNIPKHHCCEPYLNGVKSATTAESLMRSRYSAYVTGNINYILSTHHPTSRPTGDKNEILKWTLSVKWIGLTVHSSNKGEMNDSTGNVHFTALFVENGQIDNIEENSYFTKENNKWYYTPLL